MENGCDGPALQVIVLGSGGGPLEDNTTAFLVRSVATQWDKGSLLAVDAGVHLSAIARILEEDIAKEPKKDATDSSSIKLTRGPFKGLQLPHRSATANAAHVTRFLVDCCLITHPHLDHISAFVVNTASLSGSKPKRLAGLPATINAFKNHIFNNIIWPNLSDENNGAGLVTYMRLVEGGSPAIGVGQGKGYVEVCEGLSVKTWSVSHGHCMDSHSHRGSSVGFHHPSSHDPSFSSDDSPSRSNSNAMRQSLGRRLATERGEPQEQICVVDSSAYFIRDIITGQEVLIFGDIEPDSISLSPRNRQVWSDAAAKIASGHLRGIFIECSFDDSHDDDVLFGHLNPRHLIEELRTLGGFVSMSRIVLAENERAEREDSNRANSADGGRKRDRDQAADTLKKRQRVRNSNGTGSTSGSITPRRSARGQSGSSHSLQSASPISVPRRPDLERMGSSSVSPHSRPRNMSGMEIDTFDLGDEARPSASRPRIASRTTSGTVLTRRAANTSDYRLGTTGQDFPLDEPYTTGSRPLEGVKIVIIHVKDKLSDMVSASDIILEQLEAYEEDAQLGCEFLMAHVGMSIYL